MQRHDPVVLRKDTPASGRGQSLCSIYPNILNVFLDIRVIVVLQAFIECYISMCLLKNWTRGLRLRLAWKEAWAIFLVHSIRVKFHKKASGKTLEVELSNLVLIPSLCLLLWEKISSVPLLVKVIIVATPLLFIHSILASVFSKWHLVNAFYIYKEFRRKLLIL